VLSLGGVKLPLEAVTQTFGLLAVRGAGKTNAARVMAEEMFDVGLPFVAVDPVGSWFGLRAGRDGKPGGGIPIVIFGGDHGDIPLERGGGQLVADTIIEQRLSCVVDLSGFESEVAKKDFLLAFATRLYQRNRDPLHLFLEEADEYIPQKPMRDETRLLRAWENIVRRGRSRGLGMTMITQRSAAINKNVLTQVETLFTLRTTGPQDRKAIEAWVQYNDQSREILESLSGLENGEAWVWSPHLLGQTKRFKFRRSRTFDSGATPKNVKAKQRQKPATLADVDIEGLRAQMSDTIERAEADDPKLLKRRIRELEHALEAAKRAQPKPERVEVPVLDEQSVKAFELVDQRLRDVAADIKAAWADWQESTLPIRQTAANYQVKLGPVVVVDPQSKPRKAEVAPFHRASSTGLGKCARTILVALRQHGTLSLTQAAICAGYAPKSGGVRNAAGELRAAGHIEGGNNSLSITDQGKAAISDVDPIAEGEELAMWWLNKLSKAEREILKRVIAAYPGSVSLREAADWAGYEPTSGGVRNAAGKLRTLDLITGSNAAMTANARLIG